MKSFRILLAASVAGGAISTGAYAQSTGSIAAESDVIIVTGTRTSANGVDGVLVPDATKARGVLTSEIIGRQAAGQTILNTINLVPGVNFTQSDAYGSSGGNIRIRGFDGNRISLTFDGFPLNDSGNYAIFSNQQVDPELIEEVNVNMGTTDVDSPTASAAGGTVNYRTRRPMEQFGALLSGSAGDFGYSRIFGVVDTGNLTELGTRAFVSASTATNRKFKGPGKIEKFQANAKVYQPIGDNGDFVSLSGHYNANRNAFYRNPSMNDLRNLYGATLFPAAASVSATAPLSLGVLSDAQEADLTKFENLQTCTKTSGGTGAQNDNSGQLPNGTPSAPAVAGSANNNILNTSSCTNYYGVRINPSNTGNGRLNSRFTLRDGLFFTFDASYQYVLANGGGWTALAENSAIAKGSNQAGPGVDFNKDGDYSDTIGFYTPNNTNTRRWTALASLIWDISPEQRVRLAYTFDRARHRQTGEWGYLDAQGTPLSVFGGRNSTPVLNADGYQLQQRNRLSIALLNQIAFQYVGKFLDNKLRVEVGVRAPFFVRDLQTFCHIQTSGSGFATCTTQQPGTGTGGTILVVPQNTTGSYAAGSLFAPFKAHYTYNRVLPSIGVTYKFTPQVSMFGSYSKGFSAPRTDNLYRAPLVTVTPETTDAFDLGLRYTSRKIQGQITGWYIGFKNRIVTSFDQAQGISVDRNVGKVDGYGVDANLAWKVLPQLTLYGFASYNHSELKENVQLGTTTVSGSAVPILAPTAGKRVAETPEWTVGGRAQVNLGPVSIGGQYKWVDKRFATDVNDVVVPSYTIVDLDARVSLEKWGAKRTYFQLNVSNLFDKFYYGNLSTQINHGNVCPTGGTCAANGANPNFSIGAPRTIMGSVVVGF